MRTELLLALATALIAGCTSVPVPPPPLPAAPTFPITGLREPERVRRYLLGAYVDPEDPTVRHDAHAIHRIEAESRWNLGAKGDRSAVPAEIERLEETASPVAARENVKRSVVEREVAIGPDGNGMIDLTGGSGPAEANPFEVRDPQAAKEIAVTVTGVIGGARPAAIVNGHVLETGGTIDGLRVRTVEADAVVFEHGRQRLRIPVSPVSTRVRVAN